MVFEQPDLRTQLPILGWAESICYFLLDSLNLEGR